MLFFGLSTLQSAILKCYELHSSKKTCLPCPCKNFWFQNSSSPHLKILVWEGEKSCLTFKNFYFLNCPALNFQISLLGMSTCTFPGTTLHNDYHFIERVISKGFFYRLEKKVQA